MGRIKNYSAEHDTTEDAIFKWEHTQSNLTVQVQQSTRKHIAYIVPTDGDKRQLLPLQDSADEARKIAVTWMKTNPNPDF